jgi:hypothetical protein
VDTENEGDLRTVVISVMRRKPIPEDQKEVMMCGKEAGDEGYRRK